MKMVINVTDETFEVDVILKSHETPVVVDFWAEWCGPCRALGPILEKLAEEFDGKFILAKADTETTQMAASQFRVQSIPAVFALRDGQVVDGFMGALPEPQIREWLNRILPSEAELLIADAEKLLVADPEQAEAELRKACDLEPNNAVPQIKLAELLLATALESTTEDSESSETAQTNQMIDEVRQIIEKLEARGFLEPEAETVKSALGVKLQGQQTAGVAACRADLVADPENLELKQHLADALAAEESYEEALQIALAIVKADAGDFRERARQFMVDVFRILPNDSKLTSEYRRQLSMSLY